MLARAFGDIDVADDQSVQRFDAHSLTLHSVVATRSSRRRGKLPGWVISQPASAFALVL